MEENRGSVCCKVVGRQVVIGGIADGEAVVSTVWATRVEGGDEDAVVDHQGSEVFIPTSNSSGRSVGKWCLEFVDLFVLHSRIAAEKSTIS